MKNRSDNILFTSQPEITQIDSSRLVLDNMGINYLLVDTSLRIISTNSRTKEQFLHFMGIDVSEGMSVLELVSPNRRLALARIYEEVLGGTEKKTESLFEKDGSVTCMENHFKPAKNEKGEIEAVIVTISNITEFRKAENNLKEAEERWRFALEGARQGVWDWNLETGDIFYSSSYKKLYGFAEDELLGRIEEWEDMIHPEDKERMSEAIKEHLSSTDPFYESTYRIRAKDGNYRWIRARGMISYSGGKAIRMLGTHSDITDQVEAEELTRLSELQYRTLFLSNPLPCWIYDTDNLQFLEVNLAAIQHYGYSKEEFLQSSLLVLQPEDQTTKFMERVKNRMVNPHIALNNWKHKTKNGDVIFVDLRINTIQYKGRNAKLVVSHDVTAKVVVENELRKSNERFSYAAIASSEALWEWDVATDKFYISPVYTQILGWRLNDQNKFDEWHDYIHPDDRQRTIDGYYAALSQKETGSWSCEYRYLKSDGNYAYVIDKAVILRDEPGNVVKVIGALQDVTTQKKAEEELRKSNERFLLASRATSDALYDWDLATGHLHWGEGIYHLFGYQTDEVPFNSWRQHIHPQDSEKIHLSLNKALEDPGKNFWNDEYRFLKADGSYSYVLDRCFILRDHSGKATRMIGSVQDITDRKYNEQLLSLERSIFELSTNSNMEFKKILTTLLQGIENIHPEAFTSVLRLKDDDTIEALAAPRLPALYLDGISGRKIGPNEGCFGASLFLKQTVIVDNIESHPLWATYRQLAHTFGIRACCSLPIIHSSGKVMGSFTIYFQRPKAPTPAVLSTLERVRNLLRILMEHYWSLNEIRIANERFDTMMKATHDLIWDWNLETNAVYRGEMGLKKVYGITESKYLEDVNQWLDRIHPFDRDRVELKITAITKSNYDHDNFEMEYRFLKDDGSYSYVYDRAMIIRNEAGKPIRIIGAAQDITERKKLEQELLQNELERQKAINQATVDTQEQERSEIGKELHDNVNQVLTTTKLYLDLALSNEDLKDELILKSNKNIISVINEIRQLSRSLMDPSIGDLGLIDSIKDLIENINLTRKLHVSLHADKKMEELLGKNHKLTIFRIIQETLNNAIKHAKATTVNISFYSHHPIFEIVIQDDGIGFHPEQIKKGAGLKNIQNRIYLINGTHHIESAPDKGCKIIINFPLINKQ